MITLQIQYAYRKESCPSRYYLKKWFTLAVCTAQQHLQQTRPVNATLRIVDKEEGLTLNKQFKKKSYATNVLTFSYDEAYATFLRHPEHAENKKSNCVGSKKNITELAQLSHLLEGDILLCAPVIEQEAIDQKKLLLAHWAHLVVHGTLHLHGFDHELSKQAANEMEALEITILAQIGYPNPYSKDY